MADYPFFQRVSSVCMSSLLHGSWLILGHYCVWSSLIRFHFISLSPFLQRDMAIKRIKGWLRFSYPVRVPCCNVHWLIRVLSVRIPDERLAITVFWWPLGRLSRLALPFVQVMKHLISVCLHYILFFSGYVLPWWSSVDHYALSNPRLWILEAMVWYLSDSLPLGI